jgi:hypothetical protein
LPHSTSTMFNKMIGTPNRKHSVRSQVSCLGNETLQLTLTLSIEIRYRRTSASATVSFFRLLKLQCQTLTELGGRPSYLGANPFLCQRTYQRSR